MAAATYPLKWCVRASTRGFPGLRCCSKVLTGGRGHLAAATAHQQQSTFSSTSLRRAKKSDEDEQDDGIDPNGPFRQYSIENDDITNHPIGSMYDALMRSTTKEQRQGLKYDEEALKGNIKAVRDIREELTEMTRANAVPRGRPNFWNEDEQDPDLIVDEEPEFDEDDMLSMAHAKLDEHREMREYARIAIWEMPLLSKLAKSFQPPSKGQPLRWRFTSYMGEFHPAEKKVVVEFCPLDLDLTKVQQNKLKKLAGPRYNPEKNTIKMSCETFEHQAQNKRYLGDLVAKLIAEAKDPKDTFEDIPLDLRHHTFRRKPKFPKKWLMTEERRQRLAEMRERSYSLDAAKKADGKLVDGRERIREALAPPEDELALEEKLMDVVTANVNTAGRQPRRPLYPGRR